MIRTAIWLAIDTAQTLLDIIKIAAADPGRTHLAVRDPHFHADKLDEALRREQKRRSEQTLAYAAR